MDTEKNVKICTRGLQMSNIFRNFAGGFVRKHLTCGNSKHPTYGNILIKHQNTYKMKHNAFIGIAAVLCIASALLTSCREDTTVSSQITGYWYYENESPGTFDIGDSTVAYDKDINASNWRKQAVCISTTVYFGAQTQRKV